MSRITRPVGGPIPNPSREEVLLVQRLLNKHRPPPLPPIAEDGLEGPETRGAIEEFQRRVVKMARPNGRVDPGGRTFRALCGAENASQPSAPVTVTFRHQSQQPTGVTGLPGADIPTTASRYESLVMVSGGLSGTFKGSIDPDNMNVKGRIKDGTYELYLGFHKAGTPTDNDLVSRTNGFRAVLVVNANRPVPVISSCPSKVTSDGIHIHHGYNHWNAATPMSEGYLILAPWDWPGFIQLFLDAYPDLATGLPGVAASARRSAW